MMKGRVEDVMVHTKQFSEYFDSIFFFFSYLFIFQRPDGVSGSSVTRQTGRMEENGGHSRQRALKRYVREMGNRKKTEKIVV